MASDDPRVEPVNFLASLMTGYPYTITGKWFNRQAISLDGYKFDRCRFDGCQLTTSKGSFALDHCMLTQCTLIFTGEAQKVVRLHGLVVGFRPAHLRAVSNSDGTISVA